jgi:hypothetical protein
MALTALGVAFTGWSSQMRVMVLVERDWRSSSCSPQNSVPKAVRKQMLADWVVTGIATPWNLMPKSLSKWLWTLRKSPEYFSKRA